MSLPKYIHCTVQTLLRLLNAKYSCYANKSDPHHLSLNQIEQKFSVVNKSEKIRPSHLVRREGGGFRKAIVLPHYLYVSPLVVPKPSFFFEPSF